MYQTVGHQAIDFYAEAMRLPLYRGVIRGDSLQQGSDYTATGGDEVEDLMALLNRIQVRCIVLFGWGFVWMVLCLGGLCPGSKKYLSLPKELVPQDALLFSLYCLCISYVFQIWIT